MRQELPKRYQPSALKTPGLLCRWPTQDVEPQCLTPRMRVLAPEKIFEQQERFKTSLIVDGFDLDTEMVESSGPRLTPAKRENKYSSLINRR